MNCYTAQTIPEKARLAATLCGTIFIHNIKFNYGPVPRTQLDSALSRFSVGQFESSSDVIACFITQKGMPATNVLGVYYM